MSLTRLQTLSVLLTLLLKTLPPLAYAADLPATIDLDATPGAESSQVFRLYGAAAGDALGTRSSNAIAYGDVNGDGFDDLIAGAYLADPRGTSNAGETYVIYGSASLPATQIDLSATPGTHGETRIQGRDAEDWSGIAVSSGDLNADGFDDVIIGAFLAEPLGVSNSGEVYVIYGSATLGGTTINLADALGTYGETRMFGDDSQDNFGRSMTCADINGDHIDDLIVTAAGDPTGGVNAGEAYVIYGSAGLPGTVLDFNTTAGVHGETRILGDDAGDEMGAGGIACGDLNGDGLNDIVLGAANGDPDGGANAGEIYIVYGSATLPATQVDLNSTPGSTGETRVYGDDAGDGAGASVAVGDVDADGYADVIIGAFGADPAGGSIAGEAYVVYGNADLPGTGISLNSAVGSNDETRVLGDDTFDAMGLSVQAGDVNGDGAFDLLLGAPTGNGPARNDAGTLRIVYGGTAMRGTTIDLNAGGGDVVLVGDDTSDSLGQGIAANGDMNRDGFADAATGAVAGDPLTRVDAGYSAILFGNGTAPSATVKEMLGASFLPLRGIGGRLSPVLRAKLGFTSAGDAGLAEATISRSDDGIRGLVNPAGVSWELNADRGDATINLQYLDSEIAGLNEADLRLFTATALTGPWTDVSGETFDTAKNEVSASVATLAFYAFSTNAPDSVAPAANTITPFTSGPTNLGDVAFEVVFSEPVQNFNDAADVVITHSGTANTGVAVTGSGGTYTVTVNGVSGNGSFDLAVSTVSDVEDVARNLFVSSPASVAVSIDNLPPTLAIGPPSANIATAGPVTYTVTYTDAVTVDLDEGEVDLNPTGDATATVTVTGTGTTTRTVTLTDIEGDGSLGISIGAGTATDGAGNTADAGGPSATFIVDNTAPTLNFSAPSAALANTGPVAYTLTYTGASVVTLTELDIILAGTGDATGTVAVSGNGSSVRTVTLNGLSGDGTLHISVLAGSATDNAGNLAVVSKLFDNVPLLTH